MLAVAEPHTGLMFRARLPRHWEQERLLAELDLLGITDVVSLYPGGEPLLENQATVNYFHLPFIDGKVPGLHTVPDTVPKIADAVTDLVSGGSRVLVMCRCGRNRSGLIVALALMQLEKISGTKAITRLRKVRPLTPPVLSNPVYEEYLRTC